ncbi:MAG: L-threonylcarbamoyladenylate synthase [Pseudomonadota bacterium]
MKTDILKGEAGIAEAVRLLRDEQVVALPTETVYGLAGDARSPLAVGRIYAAKARPSNRPLIVHVADAERVSDWASEIPDCLAALADAFWPGPLTVVLKRSPAVPDAVSAGLETIALRVPEHPVFRAVLEAVGTGLAAPSANPYQALSPTTAEQALDGLQGRIPAVLEGGPCALGLESTILDLTAETPRVLRAGPITASEIARRIGRPVAHPEAHDAVVPGNVKAHYQPRTPLQLTPVNRESIEQAAAETAFMVWSEGARHQLTRSGVAPEFRWVMPERSGDYAQALYNTLFRIDQSAAKAILVEPPPTGEAWRGVLDRLTRSQHRASDTSVD